MEQKDTLSPKRPVDRNSLNEAEKTFSVEAEQQQSIKTEGADDYCFQNPMSIGNICTHQEIYTLIIMDSYTNYVSMSCIAVSGFNSILIEKFPEYARSMMQNKEDKEFLVGCFDVCVCMCVRCCCTCWLLGYGNTTSATLKSGSPVLQQGSQQIH